MQNSLRKCTKIKEIPETIEEVLPKASNLEGQHLATGKGLKKHGSHHLESPCSPWH
jgi:hypothetical protein